MTIQWQDLTLGDVYLARQRINPLVRRTPLADAPALSEKLGRTGDVETGKFAGHRRIQDARGNEQAALLERRRTGTGCGDLFQWEPRACAFLCGTEAGGACSGLFARACAGKQTRGHPPAGR